MKNAIYSIVIAMAWAGGVAAQDVTYSDEATQSCLADASGDACLACVGESANACMADTEGGSTTVAMGGCLDRERQFWDDRLNTAYSDLMAMYVSADAEAEADGWNTPAQAPTLKAMQRAWISYRDARCDFERAKWGGGTGGSPATAQCLMRVTAEQTLVLIDGLDGLQ